MPKKVLFVLPSLEEGGIKKIVLNLANEISKYFEIYVLAFTNSKSCRDTTPAESNVKLIIEKSTVPLVKKFRNTFPLINFSRVKNLISRISPDIVVGVPIYSILSVVLFAEKIRSSWKPKIVFWADNKFSELLNSTNFVGRLSIKLLKKKSFVLDAIVVPHTPALEDFRRYFPLTSVYLIEHPIIAEKEDKDKSKFEQELIEEIKLRKDSGNIILMAVGRIEKEKGHLLLLKAFNEVQATLQNIHLVIVGDGSLKDKLLLEATRYNISKKVLITGWVNNVSEFISLADVVINPSLREAFGNVIIEAVHQNKKLIVSNCSSGAQAWLKTLFPNITLVKPGNIPDISKRIIEAINEEPSLNYDISEISRFYVTEVGKKWKNLLERL